MSNHRYLCWPTAPKTVTMTNQHPNWPATGSHQPARHTPQFGSRAHTTGTAPNQQKPHSHQTTCPQPPPTPTRWQGTSWNEQASQPTPISVIARGIQQGYNPKTLPPPTFKSSKRPPLALSNQRSMRSAIRRKSSPSAHSITILPRAAFFMNPSTCTLVSS